MPTLLNRWRRALVLIVGALATSLACAALDTHAGTDDHSINVPTDWLTLANVTPQELAARIAASNARLVGLDVSAVTGSGEPRFTARLVANQGAYAVPGWWWFYDQSAEQLTALINANQGRLIEIDRYDRGGGQMRYAVVMVANTGTARRDWSYLLGVTRAQLVSHMRNTGSRPIDLDGFGSGSERRYNGVFVRNTGADFRLFDWEADFTPAQIAVRTNGFQGRVVKLGRLPGGRYLFVQVRNTGADASAWWHKVGFASITELDNYARQMGARPVDVVSYGVGSGRRYDAALIDNANAEERRMRTAFAPFIDANQNPLGIFSAYLKRVDGPVLVNLNGQRPAETASAIKVLHHLHTMRQVQAGSDSLGSLFKYYNYPPDNAGHVPKDRCPNPTYETSASDVYSTLEFGLDQMMKISDNRTTRGVLLRYGGFEAFNATAAAAGMVDTVLRHNVGCGYYNVVTERYDPAGLRNQTTAVDLARLYEGVRNSTLLNSTNRARAEFLESVKIDGPAGLAVRQIVSQEAAALGKSALVTDFYNLIRLWGKSGGYGTCLGDPADMRQCGVQVHTGSFAGLVAVPHGPGPVANFRHYSFGMLFSDVPYDEHSQATLQLLEAQKAAFWNDVNPELLRPAIRAALLDW